MLICVTGAKWHLPCSAFQMGSYLQEDAMLRCEVRPAVLSKWDRARRWHLRHRCEVASARRCFPNGIVSARRCYAHLRHRCEVASALQRFPNGIVSARRCYAHLRHRSVTRCRCGVASALQCFPNGIVSARRCYAHLRHRSLVRSCIFAHVDVERHLGIVLLSFGMLLHE